MDNSPFLWQSRIRFVDTDASGRIHYTSMFRHFEAAEDEFLRSIGMGYRHIEDRQVAFPRIHVECSYLAAIRYNDVVEIQVDVDRVGNSSFTLAFTVMLEGRRAAAGKITVAAMDRATQRSCPIPAGFAEALRRRLRPEPIENK